MFLVCDNIVEVCYPFQSNVGRLTGVAQVDYIPSIFSQELLSTLSFLSWKDVRKGISVRFLLPERSIPICSNAECHTSDEKKERESSANLLSSMPSHCFLGNQFQMLLLTLSNPGHQRKI